jgi:hypothetical protein
VSSPPTFQYEERLRCSIEVPWRTGALLIHKEADSVRLSVAMKKSPLVAMSESPVLAR